MTTTKLESFEQSFTDDEGRKHELSAPLLRGIYTTGFEKPTNVQSVSIIPLAIGRDAIIQAQSGMGKTGAFVIGSLTRIDWSQPCVQVIILCPTMPLAIQTDSVVRSLGAYCESVTDQSQESNGGDGSGSKCSWLLNVYGGGNRVDQEVRAIRDGRVKMIVGTLGRVAHLLRSASIGSTVKLLVVDEADIVLENRFRSEFNDIIKYMPRTVQIAFFSATISEDSLAVARNLVRHDPAPVEVLLDSGDVSLAGIKQYYIDLRNVDGEIDSVKLGTVCDIYKQLSISKVIIFANSRKRTEWLGQELIARGHSVAILHGELSKEEKMATEARFRKGEARILVSSDLLSRGFDMHNLGMVINFDLPTGSMEVETYTHRCGRTGRFGCGGVTLSLVATSQNLALIEQVNSQYGGDIKPLPTSFKEIILSMTKG